ncbi:hypothetical protein ACS0TY_007788 [Phlomoides rotata]
MEKHLVTSGDSSEPLTYKTWILRVSIHCGGCRKKVKKVLQSIEGVYTIDIDSKQHKVTVTGNVDSGILIKKLTKSGKNADLWPENSESKKKHKHKDHETASDVDEKKNENDNGNQKVVYDTSGDDHTEEKGGAPEAASQGGGGGGKKKKKKKKKRNAASTDAGGGAPPPAAAANTGSNPPHQQQVFSYPQFYYPVPEYGMSYNTHAPPTATATASMTSSYYTFPLHSYTYCRPYDYAPPPSDPVVDINRYRGDDETGCLIM